MHPDADPRTVPHVEPEVLALLERLADTVDRRAGRRGHSAEVARWAGALAAALGLGEGDVARVALAGRLHDLPALNQRPHPTDPGSATAVRAMVPADVARLVAAHGEHWDGTGLPDGLAGEAVPLGARVVAVADAFVGLSAGDAGSGPVAAPPELAELAEVELVRRSGSVFDPVVVAVFRDVLAAAAPTAAAPTAAAPTAAVPTGRRSGRHAAPATRGGH